MKSNEDLISSIQKNLQLAKIPGWLFYGFHDVDPIALKILGFPPEAHVSRRWFYLVPAEGEPRKLVHRIEPGQLDHLPGRKTTYFSWDLLERGLRNLLEGIPAVAMQYSEKNAIPSISRVDAGIVEWVRSLGTEVVSSGNLIQHFEAVWSQPRQEQHRNTARALTTIVQKAFGWTWDKIANKGETDEFRLQSYILEQFSEAGLATEHLPIVGVNRNSADPHYFPTQQVSSPIAEGDFLLLDIFAKESGDPEAVYADITWTAFLGSRPSAKILEIFDIVRRSRDAGVDFLRERLRNNRPIQGWEVDDAVRGVIQAAGYGDYFLHRTGHNLGQNVHGNGVCFDNLETHDTRMVLTGIGCTIEPGIYLGPFGVRNEINILIGVNDVEVTTPPQDQLLVFGSE